MVAGRDQRKQTRATRNDTCRSGDTAATDAAAYTISKGLIHHLLLADPRLHLELLVSGISSIYLAIYQSCLLRLSLFVL